jgi:hypothetical protein
LLPNLTLFIPLAFYAIPGSPEAISSSVRPFGLLGEHSFRALGNHGAPCPVRRMFLDNLLMGE